MLCFNLTKETFKKMLQRKLLIKPCFKKIKSDNNLLKSDFSVTKQGFNFAKHCLLKMKALKTATKDGFDLRKFRFIALKFH